MFIIGQVLAEIWNELEIDGHPVVAEHVTKEGSDVTLEATEEWRATHVRSSQYLLQIVKCDNTKCCTPFKSAYRKIVPDRFMPIPFVVQQSPKEGLKWTRSENTGHYLSLFQTMQLKSLIPSFIHKRFPLKIPYDVFNPAMSDDELKKRICGMCGMYFGTIKMRNMHHKACSSAVRSSSKVASNVSKNNVIQEQTPQRVRPVRVAAIRQREALCMMQWQEMEWISLDDLEIDNEELTAAPSVGTESGTPLVEEEEFDEEVQSEDEEN